MMVLIPSGIFHTQWMAADTIRMQLMLGKQFPDAVIRYPFSVPDPKHITFAPVPEPYSRCAPFLSHVV